MESILKKKDKKQTKRSRRVIIPPHLAEKLVKTTETLGRKYYRPLSIEIKQVYAYIYEGEGPLCRLKFLGKDDEWGFAIFKYSSMTFSTNEFMFPTKGTMSDLIAEALRAYS